MVRRLAGIGAVLACLLAGNPAAVASPPPGPGVSSGFFTFGGGEGLEGIGRVADLDSGFDVWIDPGTAHVGRIAPAIRYAVGQLHRYGINVRYRGVAAPDASTSGPGIIAVTEAASATDAACVHTTGAEAGAVIEAVAFPSLQDVGLASRVNSALVRFCAPMWSHDQHYLVAIALHEMGHAVGLGHYRGRYQGRIQVMSPVVPDVDTYQAGDRNGLRYLVAQTAALQAQSALSGTVESWQVTRQGLVVSGWALVGRTMQFADIAVTRDGTAVYRIATSTPRPDIAARYDAGWPNAGFSGSPVPMTDGIHRYCVVASVPSEPATTRTLGCRSISYPPPAPAAASLVLSGSSDAWWSSTAARIELGSAAGAALLLALVLVLRLRPSARARRAQSRSR